MDTNSGKVGAFVGLFLCAGVKSLVCLHIPRPRPLPAPPAVKRDAINMLDHDAVKLRADCLLIKCQRPSAISSVNAAAWLGYSLNINVCLNKSSLWAQSLIRLFC